MIKESSLKIILIFILMALFACSFDYEKANNQAVEKLNNQFKQENYDEMYQQSSNILKSSISKEEFTSIAKEAREKMKNVDESFTWQEDKDAHFDEGVYHDDEFSYRIMKKNGKELQIQINWNIPFQLCSIYIFSNSNESSGTGFRYCD